MSEKVYKVLTQDEWSLIENEGIFQGSEFDKNDGFIHLSTKDQALGVIDRYFQGVRPLYLAEFNTKTFGENLKWEKASNGELFPHLYDRPLNRDDMTGFDIQK